LYYSSGQYQTAIHHCTLATRTQEHSQCSPHVVHGELLPKIDDNIDNLLGLTVLYQYVLSAALNKQQRYVSVFTTEMFAYYLHCRLLSVTQCRQVAKMSLAYIGQRYAESISEMCQLFVDDILVFKSLNGAIQQDVSDKPERRKCGRSAISETQVKVKSSDLVELLHKSAVEHLTTYRQLQLRDFGSVVTGVTTDFEAVYTYKLGDYQRCLQLSMRNMCTLMYGDLLPNFEISPEFLQLLDHDIVALTAVARTIVYRDRRPGTVSMCITQLTLSLYLMIQCQLKLRHSVDSLAQTLDYIEVARRKHPTDISLNHLTLKLIARKAHLFTNH